MKLTEGEIGKIALKTLKDMADDGDLDAILYLCKKNINRDEYLQKLYEMLTIESDSDNAKRHVAKTIYEITGAKAKELELEYMKQVNVKCN